MNSKFIWFLPIFLFLTSCAQVPNSQTLPYSSPDPFYDNPRIVFRDVTVPVGRKYTFKHLKSKKTGVTAPIASLSNNFLYLAAPMDSNSINEKFNGVTEPVAIQTAVIPASPTPSMSIVAEDNAPSRDLGVKNSPPQSQSPTQSQDNIVVSAGSTYVPLTFPVPPPKSMMEQFHMKIGSDDPQTTTNNQ